MVNSHVTIDLINAVPCVLRPSACENPRGQTWVRVASRTWWMEADLLLYLTVDFAYSSLVF